MLGCQPLQETSDQAVSDHALDDYAIVGASWDSLVLQVLGN